MIDKHIATIQVRDDDDNVSGYIEVVETAGPPFNSDTPVRVRQFERNSSTSYYQTWHFEGRTDALSFALSLAGFGPLMADNDVVSVYVADGSLTSEGK